MSSYPVKWCWQRQWQHAHAMFERCSERYPKIAELWLVEIDRLDRCRPKNTVDTKLKCATNN